MFDRYLKYGWALDMLNEASEVVGYDLMQVGQEDPNQELDKV